MRIHCTLSHCRLKLQNTTPWSWMAFFSSLYSLYAHYALWGFLYSCPPLIHFVTVFQVILLPTASPSKQHLRDVSTKLCSC